jgi:beta-galactosidase
LSADGFGLGAVSQPARLRFPAAAVRSGTNVLAVLTDDWGHSEDTFVNFGAKTPRGLISAALGRGAGASCGFRDVGAELPAAPPAAPSGGIAWKIRGGAMARYPNASGLFGEREGWYRTSFDDRRWKSVKLPDGGRLGRGEVGWYRAAFRLRLPRGVRAALGIELPGTAPAELFLNGVHVARVGRDRSTRFVLPPGTVRADGRRNVLALARWAVDDRGPVARPRLFAYTTEREVALPR